MNTRTLQWLSYERALSIKYQLGAMIHLLTGLAEIDCETKEHDQLHGAVELLEGIRFQASDLMNALDGPPDLMACEIKIDGSGPDLCFPLLTDLAKEAWKKRKQAGEANE